MKIGDLEFDENLRELRRAGARLPVQKKALEVLEYLARREGRVVSAVELQRGVWGDTTVTEGSLRQALLQLRRALGADAGQVVVTVRGVGYRIGVPVTETLAAPSRAGARRDFVGRDAEMTSIDESLSVVRAGSGGVALVSGEPGIGKTRLANEVADMARQRGFRVAFATCGGEPGMPEFSAWVQVFRALGIVPEGSDVERAPATSELGAFFPRLREDRGLTAAQAQFRLFDELRARLYEMAEGAPLALIFDDLHWADCSSLRLLRFVARGLRDARLFVLGTYRDTAADLDGAVAEIVGAISCLEGVRRYPLRGLTRDDVASLLPASDARPHDAARLCDWTGGNPLFLVHVLPLLQQDGAPAEGDVFPLARGVRAAVLGLVSRARAELRALLTVAAVAGVEFDPSVLSRAARLEPAAVLALLDEAAASGLVEQVSPDVFRFVHALLRDVLYGELKPSELARHHRALALALEATSSSPGELAYHFGMSGGEWKATAARYAHRAGQLSLDRLAYDEAAGHFERALQWLTQRGSPGEALLELLLDLGSAQAAAGMIVAARATFRRAAALARAHGSGRRLAEVALRLAPGLFGVQTGVHDPYLEELLREALGVLGEIEGEDRAVTALRARLMGRLAMALYFTPHVGERERLGEHAVALARASGDRATLAFTLMTRHGSAWTPDNLDERFAAMQEAAALARPEEDSDTACVIRCFLIVDHLERGDALSLDREIQELCRAGATHGGARIYSLVYTAARALMDGRFGDVERLAFEYLALGERIDDHNARQACGVHIALCRSEQGRAAELLEPVRAYARQYAAVPGWRTLTAFLAMCAGDREAARVDLEVCARDGFAALPRDFLWLGGLSRCALVAAELEDARSAAALYALLSPYAAQYAAIGYGVATLGSIEGYLGVLSAALSGSAQDDWHRRARLHLSKGIERNRAAGIRTHAAWCEADLGLLLTKPGESEVSAVEGRAWIASARRTATSLGMQRLLQRLQERGPPAPDEEATGTLAERDELRLAEALRAARLTQN